MTDDFLTQGLQEDRYLKAVRLIDQFESEIEARLHNVGQKMMDRQQDLFESGIEGNEYSGHDSSVLAYARVDFPMIRVKRLGSDQQLKLNVHLYWSDPTKYNRADIDGALRAFGYKIKNAAKEDNEHVIAETRDWPLETSTDPFTSTTVFYRHVDSESDIQRTAETLIDHFGEFGETFGVVPDT